MEQASGKRVRGYPGALFWAVEVRLVPTGRLVQVDLNVLLSSPCLGLEPRALDKKLP